MDHTVGATLTVRNHIYCHTQHTVFLEPSRNIAVDVRNACFIFYINFVHLASGVQFSIMPLGPLQFTAPLFIVYTYLIFC